MKQLALIAASLWPLLLAAAPNPAARPTAEARLELLATAQAGDIKSIEALSPRTRIERMQWADPSGQGRGCVVHLPIVHYAWTRLELEFTAANDGVVFLKLMAPVAKATNTPAARQEVMWDDVQVSDVAITNGSFEEYVGNLPVGWEGGGVANVGPMPALKGVNFARVWQNRTLKQAMTVKAGKTYTVSIGARTMPLIGPGEMRRIPERDTLAHQAAAYYQRGANAGNFLEVPPGQNWSVEHTEADFRQMKAEGFDHVRIPVGWQHYTGPAPDFKIAPEFFKRVDTVATNALKQGLFVILNLHHFDEFTSDPMRHTNKFVAIWRQVSQHYAAAHPGIALELLNEPKDAATTEVMNPIYAQVLKIIRGHNPMRTVFIGPGKWNSVDELSNLRLPDDEENVIVTVHCYEPFYFTHQGASWAGDDVKPLKGIVYPGPPPQPVAIPGLKAHVQQWLDSYNTRPTGKNPVSKTILQNRLQQAFEWSSFYGRPVHVGEFGCYTAADAASRARYYEDLRRLAEQYKVGFALWDWKAGFKYWDADKQAPAPGMREALFNK